MELVGSEEQGTQYEDQPLEVLFWHRTKMEQILKQTQEDWDYLNSVIEARVREEASLEDTREFTPEEMAHLQLWLAKSPASERQLTLPLEWTDN